jgi:4-diphosphocytidyl-2-C-methyl-D-erythritol kinase
MIVAFFWREQQERDEDARLRRNRASAGLRSPGANYERTEDRRRRTEDRRQRTEDGRQRIGEARGLNSPSYKAYGKLVIPSEVEESLFFQQAPSLDTGLKAVIHGRAMSFGEKIELRAPAKVNLFLEVLGRRDNGYHDIRSVIAPISLFDKVELEAIDGEVEVVMTPGPDLRDALEFPESGSNIAAKAANLIKKECGFAGGVRIRIEKNIPLGGGLGGGSSDAAAVLLGLNRLWKLGLSIDRICELGAKLGCDVPAFILGGPVSAEGLGEKVVRIPLSWNGSAGGWWLVLINPGFPVSTADIYSRIPGALTFQPERYKNMKFALGRLDLGKAAGNLFNALEAVACCKYPVLGILADRLRAAGALGVQVSGSGASLFGLAKSESDANRIEGDFRKGLEAPVWSRVVRILPDGVMAAHGPLEAIV